MIKVLIVEDSPSVSAMLKKILSSDPQIEVVGTAYNGKDAVELVPKLKPDIITMDIHLPVMDGFEATKQIMAYNPTPILVISASVFTEGMNKVFKAISYGALDVIEKKEMVVDGDQASARQLIEKVKFLSTIKVLHHPLAKLEEHREKVPVIVETRLGAGVRQDRIVAIACSTGGPQALAVILKKFPKNFPCGVVVVQHIASGFDQGLASWLDSECNLQVKIAMHNEEIRPGVVYIAPCDLQMRVTSGGRIAISAEPARGGHLPAGDVLLESVAQVYKNNAVGVILTGMGRDGALGIKAIKDARGRTIAQDEKSSVVFGMPKAAIELGAADKISALEDIAGAIAGMLH
jgi:two-component system, chemotaxis family, protein-glutamate methylesterase/glutaminase